MKERNLFDLCFATNTLAAGFGQELFTAGASTLPSGVYKLIGYEFVRLTGAASTGLYSRLECVTTVGTLTVHGIGMCVSEAWVNGRISGAGVGNGDALLPVPDAASMRMYLSGAGGAGDTYTARWSLERVADYRNGIWVPHRRYSRVEV